MEKADIGIIGLGVMGQNLALNMERNGYRVAGYDIDTQKVDNFVAAHPEKKLVSCATREAFVAAMERPRKIMMMVTAGAPVDAVIKDIKPLLEQGDLLIDGGNSFFKDTERRAEELEANGILYIGTGVSGGEEGALWGPSIMPGGKPEAWEILRPVFEAIAAKVDDEPCVTYIGPGGSGHYVKMIHNGIEYGDMQLIAEAYDIMHRGLGLTAEELHQVFAEWNEGELSSYLIEITRDIFARLDQEIGKPLVDLILDEAKQKGTGKWTSQNALDLGVPTPTINAAVESRIISAYKEERVAASEVISGPEIAFDGDRNQMIKTLQDALYAAKICSYAQGMALLKAASDEYDYNLDKGDIARIWRGGCIIRARLLEDIRAAYSRNPKLVNLLMDPFFREAVDSRQAALRTVVGTATGMGIPVLAMSASLAYFDAYRTARLPANLTQAQRDYFGAHTYRRIDKEGVFHTEWTK
ncbi:MAG: NADP-dependent phosphogluconate dehydrogenase [Anaerolineales bacterium]|nr:MAG: NADP-dependent phosphogluconate dehydrogenase [Anaerolineales bacterium]